MNFPIYRKLNGFPRFYCIKDDRQFEEVFMQGGKMMRMVIHATQYPEILRIQDMLTDTNLYHEMDDEEIKNYFP